METKENGKLYLHFENGHLYLVNSSHGVVPMLYTNAPFEKCGNVVYPMERSCYWKEGKKFYSGNEPVVELPDCAKVFNRKEN